MDEGSGIARETEFPVTVGDVYVVYGITTWKGHCWYYVLDDNELPYPVWELASLFEVSDPSLPHDWVAGFVRNDENDEGFPVISFPDWALDNRFYERLVEGDVAARAVFDARRLSG